MAMIVGELAGILGLDDDPFQKGLDRAMSKGEKSATQRMKRIGDKMTLALSSPLAGVGLAGIKVAADYETAFARMVGLAGVPAAEIDNLKQSVLDLAGRTAVAPAELADALYFAASSGLTAAAAMEAVEISAQGAAAGLGRTQDIVGLVSSAIAAYGADNLTAARAVDILTGTIKAGKAEPAEMAAGLGGLLPIASKLGIPLEQVGGAVAYLSIVFGDTNRTLTATQGLLVKLLAPTAQGRKALEEMGTSADELQAAIDDRGLTGALELLRSKGFAGNQQALRALFDDIEGFQAAVALLDDKSGRLAGTMDSVAGSRVTPPTPSPRSWAPTRRPRSRRSPTSKSA